jgi:HK97 family phage portal protein
MVTVLQDIGYGSATDSGIGITPAKALTSSAVFACVRILSETVASLPLMVYERLDRGKARAADHYLYQLLHDRPNDLLTSFEFREILQGHLALWGNAYAEIEYSGGGQVMALWPLRPDRMIQATQVNGRRLYHYQLPDGKTQWLTNDKVWHLRGLSNDGLNGYSPIALMRQAVGLSMAAEKFGAKFFGNDARPGGILEHPGQLGDEAAERLKETWQSRHGGLSGAHRVAVLEEGLSYKEIGIPPDDAQFLDTRKFQVTEIARIYRIPPHMLADLERATFSNIEHQSIDFVTHAIRPWLVRWEQSIKHNLMVPSDRDQYFAEFLVDGLLRGDTKSRYEAYAIGRQNGWFSADDIREMENLNPLPDGKGEEYLIPLNMIPAGSAPPEPAPADDEGRAANQWRVEKRQAANNRWALMKDYMPLYRETTGRFVRREVADVKRAARKYLKSDDLANFVIWLDGFYEDHRAFIEKTMAPTMSAYGGAVARAVESELDDTGEIKLDEFISQYLGLYSLRYTNTNRRQMTAAIQRAQVDDTEVLPAIEHQLDYWDDTRPEIEAQREVQRANNAIAIVAYGAMGVLRKRWRAGGDACPYCRSLDGAVVEVSGNFVPAGGSVVVEGQPPLPININMGHPPAHDGCDCIVLSE